MSCLNVLYYGRLISTLLNLITIQCILCLNVLYYGRLIST